MSTPQAKHDATPPPKTPGWGQQLFGFLSTAKKPRNVDVSTTPTEPMETSTRSRSNNIDITLKSPSENGGGDPSGIDALTSNGASNSPVALATFARRPASMATKSPWKSPSMNGGAKFSLGKLKSTPAKKAGETKHRAASKQRRYKGSKLLFKTRRGNGAIDRGVAINAIQRSQFVFKASKRQTEARDNYTAFKPGKRVFGSNQRASRLPSTEAIESVSEVQSESMEIESNKRQKKVSFTESSAAMPMVAAAGMSTPARIELPKKATPFKPQTFQQPVFEMESPSAISAKVSSPTVNKKILLPLPPVDLIVKEPYDDIRGTAEVETLGTPADGDLATMFTFAHETKDNKNIRHPEISAKYFDATESAAPTKSKSSKSDKGVGKVTQEGAVENEKKRTKSTYKCEHCGASNDYDNTACSQCGKTRKTTSLGWGDLFKDQSNKWKCPACYVQNDEKNDICASCESPRPGSESSSAKAKGAEPTASSGGGISSSGFSFGAPKSTDKSDSKISSSGFSFGAPATASSGTASTGGFKFGGSSSPAPASGSSSGFSFGGSKGGSSPSPAPAPSDGKSVSGFTFGGSAPSEETKSSTTSSSGGFTFGGSSAAPASDDKKKSSGFTFGATSDSGPSTDAAKPPAFSFGSNESKSEPKPESSEKTASGFKFNLTSSEKPKEPAKPAFSFGSAPTAADKTPPPKTTSVQPPKTEPTQKRNRPDASNDVTKSASKANTTKPFTFGSSEPPKANDSSSKPSFSFGASASDAPPKPAFSFGNQNNDGGATKTAEKPQFSFGSAPAPSAPSAETPSAGGSFPKVALGSIPSKENDDRSKRRRDGNASSSSAAPSFGTGSSSASSSFQFGSTAPAPAMPTGGMFGSKSAGADSNDAPTPSVTAPAPTTGGFSFGGKPAAPTLAPAFTFGGGSAGNTASAPTTAPSFGSSTPAPSAPTNAAPMFGGAQDTTSSAPAFGSSAPAAPAFGATPAPAPNPFGSAPTPAPAPGFSFGSTPSAAPAFGSTAPSNPPAFGAAPPANPPAFGSTPASSAPSFGGGQTPAAPAFGSAPTPGAPAFGSAPTPGFGSTPQPPAFGSSTPAPAPSFGGGFGSTPAAPAPAGFGSAPPSAGGFGGGGFGAAPAPAMGMNQGSAPQFSLGTSGTKTRRKIRARRPGGSRPA